MISEKIALSKERNVYLTTYLIENSKELHPGLKRPLIIICPGGGYAFHSDREAEPIALKYLASGFDAAVLTYGINEFAKMPGPVKDAADAVYYIKSHADEWYVDKDKVFISGFSAGAHCAASLGCFWNNADILPEYKDCQDMIKPAGLILGYPVLDLRASTTHLDIGIKKDAKLDEIDFGQIHPNMPLEKIFVMDEKLGRRVADFEVAMNAYIFGGEYTDEEEDFYSLQNQVTADTPQTFIWHTAGDGLILPKNSLQFATKLSECEVPYELHIFSKGDHGLALGDYVTANFPHEDVPCVTPWMELAIRWINRCTGFDKGMY